MVTAVLHASRVDTGCGTIALARSTREVLREGSQEVPVLLVRQKPISLGARAPAQAVDLVVLRERVRHRARFHEPVTRDLRPARGVPVLRLARRRAQRARPAGLFLDLTERGVLV